MILSLNQTIPDEKVVDMQEWSTKTISRNKAGELSKSDLSLRDRLKDAKIEIDELPEGFRVRTGHFVGRVTLDAFDLIVRPKLKEIPLHKLFLYAFDLAQFRTLGQHITTENFFAEILTAELIAEVRSIQRRGPFQLYQKRQKNMPELRGQIDRHAWLRRGGVPSETLPCMFYHRCHDNVLNQTLCGGLKLGTLLSRSAEIKTACRMLADTFALSVSETPLSKRLIADAFRHLNRLNAHYEQALRIVRLLYDGIGGFAHGKDRFERIPGFLFNMNLLFEKCLERFFRENLPGKTFTPQKDFQLFSFDPQCNPKNQGKFGFMPDYTFEHEGKTIILDAKYRDLWEKPLPTSMLYQLAVYAIAAASPHQSVILYPTLNPKAMSQKIDLTRDANGKCLCSVILKPVDLNKLAMQVSGETGPTSRQYFAESLVLFHHPEISSNDHEN